MIIMDISSSCYGCSQTVTFAIKASLFSLLFGRRSRGLMEAELVIVYFNDHSDWREAISEELMAWRWATPSC